MQLVRILLNTRGQCPYMKKLRSWRCESFAGSFFFRGGVFQEQIKLSSQIYRRLRATYKGACLPACEHGKSQLSLIPFLTPRKKQKQEVKI